MSPEERDLFKWPADLDEATGLSPMRRSAIIKTWVEKTKGMGALDPQFKMDLDVLAMYADEIAATVNTKKMDNIARGLIDDIKAAHPEVGVPSDPQYGPIVSRPRQVQEIPPSGFENKPLFKAKSKEMRDLVAEMDLEQQETMWQAWHDAENELREVLNELGDDARSEELIMR